MCVCIVYFVNKLNVENEFKYISAEKVIEMHFNFYVNFCIGKLQFFSTKGHNIDERKSFTEKLEHRY